MTHSTDLLGPENDERISRMLWRAKYRGTQLRRRRMVLRNSAPLLGALAVTAAVIVPYEAIHLHSVQIGFNGTPTTTTSLPPGKSRPTNGGPKAANPPSTPLNSTVPECGAQSCSIQGIISPEDSAQASTHTFSVSNGYGGTYDGQDLLIWAGEQVGPPSGPNGEQAVVGGELEVILNNNADSGSYYPAPNSPGWIEVTAVTGDVVSLVRQDGSALSFNLVTDEYSG